MKWVRKVIPFHCKTWYNERKWFRNKITWNTSENKISIWQAIQYFMLQSWWLCRSERKWARSGGLWTKVWRITFIKQVEPTFFRPRNPAHLMDLLFFLMVSDSCEVGTQWVSFTLLKEKSNQKHHKKHNKRGIGNGCYIPLAREMRFWILVFSRSTIFARSTSYM